MFLQGTLQVNCGRGVVVEVFVNVMRLLQLLHISVIMILIVFFSLQIIKNDETHSNQNKIVLKIDEAFRQSLM